MKINIAKSAGFCFGVKRAIKIAGEAANSGWTVEILGDIVHNKDVIKDIKKSGITKVRCLVKGKNKALLIRAHGTPLKTIKKAEKLKYKIIDTTCPKVKEIHRIAVDMEKQGRKIIIIGDKKHAEVRGIVGQLISKPLVIENEKSIPFEQIKKIKKACLVVQSTQNIEEVRKIFYLLKKQIKNLKFFNTICGPTRAKQNEIKSMPLENDLIIIIGSKTSANTKRLYQISKLINKKSYWVQSSQDIDKIWFKKVQSVGITAGASTPNYTTKNIINRIKKLTTVI
ncbi:MAG: 4-hydroxy-3-methylbut-2-enyl diphosphate reductase [Candidatus Omnitrophota bacterium]